MYVDFVRMTGLTWECDPTRGRYSIGNKATNGDIRRLCTAFRTEVREANGDESSLQQEGHTVGT